MSTTVIADDNDDVLPNQTSFKDVSGDGETDLVLHFRTPDLNTAGLLVDGAALLRLITLS
ncbi:MAG: hypothetical protein GTO24_01795 [candidate division Zixibacteria bacterium]|nr:hypothetical protein [candidate division Zixibacteria bacterium]